MFIPIGDRPRLKGFTAYISWGLIAFNLSLFTMLSLPLLSRSVDLEDPLLESYLDEGFGSFPDRESMHIALESLSAYDLFLFRHGYQSAEPSLEDLLFSLFLHEGIWHLFGNMLFLWIFGAAVERRLGRLLFLFLYLGGGIFSTLLYGVLREPSLGPLVGASGAISAVLGLHFWFFAENRIKTVVAFFPFYFNVIEIPARWALAVYLVIDNILPWALGLQNGVAHGAHVGGFLCGLVFAMLVTGLGHRADLQWSQTE